MMVEMKALEMVVQSVVVTCFLDRKLPHFLRHSNGLGGEQLTDSLRSREQQMLQCLQQHGVIGE
jgi:hypothetical protein